MENPLDRFPLYEDAFNFLCHELIASGAYRTVYTCRFNPDLVIKVERQMEWREFSNVKEMAFWCDNQYYEPVAKWLAPCEYMSPGGWLLAQRRVTPLTPQQIKELPEQLPAFLTDIKHQNFGMLDGRLVCVDYASVLLHPSVKMRKVTWL
jgi:hypothetical protein